MSTPGGFRARARAARSGPVEAPRACSSAAVGVGRRGVLERRAPAEPEQSLLRAVVEVALEPAALLVAAATIRSRDSRASVSWARSSACSCSFSSASRAAEPTDSRRLRILEQRGSWTAPPPARPPAEHVRDRARPAAGKRERPPVGVRERPACSGAKRDLERRVAERPRQAGRAASQPRPPGAPPPGWRRSSGAAAPKPPRPESQAGTSTTLSRVVLLETVAESSSPSTYAPNQTAKNGNISSAPPSSGSEARRRDPAERTQPQRDQRRQRDRDHEPE